MTIPIPIHLHLTRGQNTWFDLHWRHVNCVVTAFNTPPPPPPPHHHHHHHHHHHLHHERAAYMRKWTRTNADSEIWIGILSISFKKMDVKMSSARMAAILSRKRWVKHIVPTARYGINQITRPLSKPSNWTHWAVLASNKRPCFNIQSLPMPCFIVNKRKSAFLVSFNLSNAKINLVSNYWKLRGPLSPYADFHRNDKWAVMVHWPGTSKQDLNKYSL